MKKSNRIPVRVLAFCLSCVMLFGCLSVGIFAADYPISGGSDKNYALTLSTADNANVSTLNLAINADALGEILEQRDPTKEDLKSFLPDLIWNALENKDIPSPEQLIDALAATGLLSYSTLTEIFPKYFVDLYLNRDLVVLALSEDAMVALLNGASDTQEVKDALAAVITDPALKAALEAGNYAVLVEALGKDRFVETVTARKFLSTVGMTAFFDVADKEILKAQMKEMAKSLVNRMDSLVMSADGKDYPVYFVDSRDGMYALDLNAAKNAALAAVPAIDVLENVTDGGNVLDFVVTVTLRGENNVPVVATYILSVTLQGDTAKINEYAEKANKWISYSITDDDVTATLDDTGAPATIAGAMNKVLSTSRLTDAEKIAALSVFDMKGDELVAKLESFDLSASKLGDILEENEIAYVAKARDLTVKALKKLLELAPEQYVDKCLADLYNESNGAFELKKSGSVSAVSVAEKLMGRFDFASMGLDLTNLVEDHPVTQSVDLSLTASNISRVRYYDINQNLIYTTFLPVGASLDLIEANADELIGKQGTAGWVNKADRTACDTVPAEDLDMIASNQTTPPGPSYYTVTFIADGEVVDVVRYNYGDTELSYIPEVPAKAGYTGVWESFTLNNTSFEVHAIYTADTPVTPVKTYTVTFVADGVTVTILQYKHGQTTLYGIPEVPEKAGYTGKWEEFTLNNTNITVNAVYTPIAEYKATFMADGKVVKEITFLPGATTLIGVPAVPAKTGYTGKWADYKLADADIIINAIYTANTYTVNFNANGGSGSMAAQTMTYDQSASLTKNTLTRTGYTFNGWNTKADGTGTAYADGASVKNLIASGSVTLYAQWKEAEKPAETYTATFKADGKVIATIEFKAGDKTLSGVPEVPAKAGYTGKWAEYTLSNANITIEAVYTANTYTVIFDANGGSGTMASQTMTYDMAAALTANTLTREGYTFNGWNTKADGTGTSYADGASVKNLAESGEVTLYAQWKEGETVTPPVVTPPEEKKYTGAIVGILVAFVLITAGVAVASVMYTKKKYKK